MEHTSPLLYSMRSVGRLSLVQALTDHGRTPTVCLPELYTQNSDIVSILNPLIAIHTVILTMAVVFHKTGRSRAGGPIRFRKFRATGRPLPIKLTVFLET